jgi:hypothetical protein
MRRRIARNGPTDKPLIRAEQGFDAAAHVPPGSSKQMAVQPISSVLGAGTAVTSSPAGPAERVAKMNWIDLVDTSRT